MAQSEATKGEAETEAEVDRSQFEMASAGTKFKPARKPNRKWEGVPELTSDSGSSPAYWVTALTAGEARRMHLERRELDEEGRVKKIDDTRDGERRLAWALRDGENRRCWKSTADALAEIDDWPEEVVERLYRTAMRVSAGLEGEQAASAEGNSPKTPTGS